MPMYIRWWNQYAGAPVTTMIPTDSLFRRLNAILWIIDMVSLILWCVAQGHQKDTSNGSTRPHCILLRVYYRDLCEWFHWETTALMTCHVFIRDSSKSDYKFSSIFQMLKTCSNIHVSFCFRVNNTVLFISCETHCDTQISFHVTWNILWQVRKHSMCTVLMCMYLFLNSR